MRDLADAANSLPAAAAFQLSFIPLEFMHSLSNVITSQSLLGNCYIMWSVLQIAYAPVIGLQQACSPIGEIRQAGLPPISQPKQ